MTANRDSASSLRSERAIVADSALGPAGRDQVGRGIASLRRFSPAAVAARVGRGRFPLAAPSWPDSVPRPLPTSGLGVDYDTAWSRKYPARLARAGGARQLHPPVGPGGGLPTRARAMSRSGVSRGRSSSRPTM